jgi:hypothetical protein
MFGYELNGKKCDAGTAKNDLPDHNQDTLRNGLA